MLVIVGCVCVCVQRSASWVRVVCVCVCVCSVLAVCCPCRDSQPGQVADIQRDCHHMRGVCPYPERSKNCQSGSPLKLAWVSCLTWAHRFKEIS